MKLIKNNIYFILTILMYVITFSGIFHWNVYENNIQSDVLPYLIGYYVVVIILYFSILNIIYNFSCNDKSVLFKKLQIQQILNKLDKKNKLNLFLEFCSNKNNMYIIDELSKNLSTSENDKIKELIKSEKYNDAKQYLIDISQTKNKDFKKLVEKFDLPFYFNYFLMYYNGELLKKKKSIFGFITGFISFIVAIIPFVLTGISSISLWIYFDFGKSLILLIFDIPRIIKYTIKDNINDLNMNLIKIEQSVNEFEKNSK